mmetsp:Transcript_24270/g.31337  ORF Transcript_24270/g.31337 Transcript_24270/m.31337 type:complete len:171 (+) Transcript_24270:247-759(+)|eukprot:CAMPEP_0117750270 /NCGR_PEP_ID=MMETSP0947-20121206/10255_1 /TAXON_ID=44440 /ORGANISM="Chattonella subsalsa, Strain CCMP2191" /LENGTH=170 /DNA_ID=CAMNT_0005568379 /DNA_START=190 /DNA_END=702 /DNA_ORIENTATION=+
MESQKQPQQEPWIPTLVMLLISVVLGALFIWGNQPIVSEEKIQEELAFLQLTAEQDGVEVLPSGLQYKVLSSGPEGGSSPGPSTPCACHYEGKTRDGTVFDSSYKRGEPTVFAPNQVIRGWTEALQLMKQGDIWELYIPSDLAYGNRQMGPHIYPGATLIFKLELVEVKN